MPAGASPPMPKRLARWLRTVFSAAARPDRIDPASRVPSKEITQKMFTRRASPSALAVFALLAAPFVSPASGLAQGHEAGGHAAPAAGAPPALEHANTAEAHGSEHPFRDLAAKLLNFGILVGVL